MKITTIRTAGLGDSTHLLLVDGVAVLVDPQRDYQRFLHGIGDATLRYVLETHLHNDYVSGGLAVVGETGAELVLPAAAGAAFPNLPAFHLEDIDAGPFKIRPLHTPGHTPEHTSYVILIEDNPVAVFSGGSLLVGSAGRTDLLGEARAHQLAKLQYGSVTRLGALPGEVGLYPTHGEGSFCATSRAGLHTSTIGAERTSNPALQHADAESFADEQLSGLPRYPTYYARMGPINLAGPQPIDDERPPTLSISEMVAILDVGEAAVIDIRPPDGFATGHLPGSIGLGLADAFGTWAGWLIDFDRPIALVATPDQDIDEAWVQLSRIGKDRHAGVFFDLEGWVSSGHAVVSFVALDLPEFINEMAASDGIQFLDVRDSSEFASGAVDGSIHCYLPDLCDEVPTALDSHRPVFVACGTGYRATAAAEFLIQAGLRPIVLARGGVPDLLDATSGS